MRRSLLIAFLFLLPFNAIALAADQPPPDDRGGSRDHDCERKKEPVTS